MDALANYRRSRWDRAPALDSRGRQKRAQLTGRDLEIFKLLARYRHLSIDDIDAFVGGSRKGLPDGRAGGHLPLAFRLSKSVHAICRD